MGNTQTKVLQIPFLALGSAWQVCLVGGSIMSYPGNRWRKSSTGNCYGTQQRQEPAVSQGEVWVLECLPRLAGGGIGEVLMSDSWRNEVPLPLPPFSVLGVLVGLGLSYLLGDSYGFRMGLTCSGGMWPLPPGTGGDLLWRRWPPSLLLPQGKCSEWIWVHLLPSPQMHSWLALILILNTFHVYYDRHIGFTPSK